MGLETYTFISSFNTSWPDGATDVKGQGDNHLRGIKTAVLATFPNASAAFYFPSTQSKTSAHTVVAADQNKIILCDATGGAFTLTLTAAATLGSRFRFTAIKTDSSSNAITVDGNAAETINGATTFSISKQYQSATFVCNGSTWYVEQGNTASATVAGEVELATTTEVLTGTDATRAVTPDALAALWERQSSDPAQAVSMSLGEGGFFNVTGSGTSITDITFATHKDGRRAWLRFAGAGTLVHNGASFVLPGSADIAFPADTLVEVIAVTGATTRVAAVTRGDGSPISLASTTDVLTGTNAVKPTTADALAALWEQGSNITAAATISVGEGGYFTVTGNTGISDIDFATDKAGRGAWLRFTGTPLLTHSSTLPLPNSANYQVVAGDMMYVVSEGSDTVRVLSIMRVTGFPVYPTLVASTTDNAAIRADGTGGNTQNSAFIIDDSGHVTSFGGNISFPASQAASAGANVLDDYEEGTATISLTATTTPPTGVTYSAQTLTYTKIGRMVQHDGRETISSKGASGVGIVKMTGLPFSLAGNQLFNIGRYGSVTLPSSGIGLWGLSNGTEVSLGTNINTGVVDVNWADIGASFDFFYQTTGHV